MFPVVETVLARRDTVPARWDGGEMAWAQEGPEVGCPVGS